MSWIYFLLLKTQVEYDHNKTAPVPKYHTYNYWGCVGKATYIHSTYQHWQGCGINLMLWQSQPWTRSQEYPWMGGPQSQSCYFLIALRSIKNMEVNICIFLKLTLDGGQCLVLPYGQTERAQGTYWLGNWVILDMAVKRKI